MDQYYNDFKSFKDQFIYMLHPMKKYERYKVWAQWLIRSLCKNKYIFHLIPAVKDTEINVHLREKGFTTEQTTSFVQWVDGTTDKLHNKYNKLIGTQFNGTDINKKIKYNIQNDCHVFECGSIYVKYTNTIFSKIMKRYQGSKNCVNFCSFDMGFNYYMLEGQSFQWCVPPNVMTTIEHNLSTKTEMFASPINAVLPYYYSLFVVDRYFGGVDNFFNIESNSPMKGTFEINPPFIDDLFIRSSRKITDLLNHNIQEDLMFIYIMPDWLDSEGYLMLKNNRFLLDEILLKENEHLYYQTSTNKMITVNFETHIMILGTDLSKQRWTPDIKNSLIRGFGVP